MWTERDRDAEEIRKVLRKANHKEFGQKDGRFVVEGGGDGKPFSLACTIGDQAAALEEVRLYREALAAVGFRAEQDLEDDKTLDVWVS
ncbi:hypothetical protein [Streptomyces tendae]|uniref:hypothetical protein n=1 Tax=Streptomyces tendae TaxID=1932 RepID=UPI0024903F44|nr:hypothetical protein [Streptomyces tendae]